MTARNARVALLLIVLLFVPAFICGTTDPRSPEQISATESAQAPIDALTKSAQLTQDMGVLNLTATYVYAQATALYATQTAEAVLTQKAAKPAPPQPDQFTKANLAYLGMKDLTAPGEGGPPNWCFTGAVPDAGDSPTPPFSVAPDGALTGVCKGAIKSYQMTWTGSSTGQWDPQTAVVTWTLAMTIVEQGNKAGQTTVRTVKIDGSGPLTAAAGVVSARGTATWTDTCAAGGKLGDGFQRCLLAGLTEAEQTGYSHQGTLDWSMTFTP